MRTASTITLGNATRRPDASVGKNDADVGILRRARRPFEALMRRARSIRRNKTAHELARITGRSVRTAERWLSGELTPDGEATLALFLSDFGPQFLEVKVAELSPAAQEEFWREMGRAQKRADIRRRQEALQREIDEAGL